MREIETKLGGVGRAQATGRERLEKFTKVVAINLATDQH